MHSQLKKYRIKHELEPEEREQVMSNVINSIREIEEQQSDRRSLSSGRRSKSSRRRSQNTRDSKSCSPARPEKALPTEQIVYLEEELVFGSGDQQYKTTQQRNLIPIQTKEQRSIHHQPGHKNQRDGKNIRSCSSDGRAPVPEELKVRQLSPSQTRKLRQANNDLSCVLGSNQHRPSKPKINVNMVGQNNMQIQIGASSHNRLLAGQEPLSESNDLERPVERRSKVDMESNRVSVPSKASSDADSQINQVGGSSVILVNPNLQRKYEKMQRKNRKQRSKEQPAFQVISPDKRQPANNKPQHDRAIQITQVASQQTLKPYKEQEGDSTKNQSVPQLNEVTNSYIPKVSLFIAKQAQVKDGKEKENLSHPVSKGHQTELDTLIKKNQAYNVFKKSPDLMALFDACKDIESHKRQIEVEDLDGLHHSMILTDEESSLLENKSETPRTPATGKNSSRLPKVSPPYLPPKEANAPEYTLVLDLDETLIHYVDGNRLSRDEDHDVSLEVSPEHEDEPCFFIRPGLNQFLTRLAHHYELVLYTAAMRDYANYFMDQIDQKGLFSHILCREHCQYRSDREYSIKDLNLIGRDLAKTIIVDNLAENFNSTCPNNGIHIKDFKGSFEDNELYKLRQFLENIAIRGEPDVRTVIAAKPPL